MKKVIRNTKTLILVAVAGASLMSFSLENTPTETTNPTEISEAQQGPVMVFEETEYQFGKINQGEKVTHTFVFNNTGDAPLIINSASGSCGCTVPEWPHEPILPGAKGEVNVIFNSAGKRGPQNKSVTLNTNQGDTPIRIYIKGEVIVPTSTAPATH
tara:strand:- start:230 stop:700 length:471 start_codon:yes stop_codon:yes gene_type:complete